MAILPPRLSGPLSECSRSARFQNAIPGATVFLLRIRGGATDRVGETVATQSSGVVSLFGGEEFVAGDFVTAYQETPTDVSDPQPDAIEVQRNEANFNPPQVLTHLYRCSRGFQVGGVRPGTNVEVLQAGSVIAKAEATNGIAFLPTDQYGLPAPGTVLTVRQRVCPKPPPPAPATEWVIDSQLPPVEPLQSPVGPGGTLPAPAIVSGLTDCSRSVRVEKIIPGAEVIIESPDTGWWAWLGPSDATSGVVPLPVMLREGEHVEIRQEVGLYCEMQSERAPHTVEPREILPKPQLWQIDCNTSPVVFILPLKEEADLEFEVVFDGETKTYRSVATKPMGYHPAPPMPAGATVRVRQGECAHWSDWSDPQTAKALAQPVPQPEILGTLFQCQHSVPVKNLVPLSGIVRVRSNVLGTIAQMPVNAETMSITVAPSLIKDHDITVEHEICGITAVSEGSRVQPLTHPMAGTINGPLYDGDTSVTVRGVTSGAYVELWDLTHRIAQGYAPYGDQPEVDMTFSGLPPLVAGTHIYSRFWYCGHYGRNEGAPVEFRAPVLSQIQPNTVNTGSPALTLTAKGSAFRSGARVQWNGADRATTFVSATELRAAIPASDVASAGTPAVRVVNPDGKTTGTLQFTVVTPPPQITGYDRNTLIVTGINFLKSATVYVRLTASGSVPDGYGGTRADLRDNYISMVITTSDASGKISVVVDPKTELDAILIDAETGATWLGAYPGQTVAITAHDGRAGSGFDGKLWSNAFSYTV